MIENSVYEIRRGEVKICLQIIVETALAMVAHTALVRSMSRIVEYKRQKWIIHAAMLLC